MAERLAREWSGGFSEGGGDMSDRKYDFIIAGSGAGGATLAKELSGSGKDVLVIEKGKQENQSKKQDAVNPRSLQKLI